MTVLIAGATGLVGSHLLSELIIDDKIDTIHILVRQHLEINSPKVNQILFDYNNKEEYIKLPAVDALFCCLGTTIKKAKTKANFLKVDLEYPLLLAQHVQTNAFLLVSSMGANENSAIFYTQTKGKLENSLKALPIQTIHIFRPSQLSGNRKEKRFGERISERFLRLLNSLIPKDYQLIKAKTVAKAMKIKALNPQKGHFTYLSGEINKIVNDDEA
jgi:uncharacterized protein YbjT (DUF2867 family)